jgi:hypothetical protein
MCVLSSVAVVFFLILLIMVMVFLIPKNEDYVEDINYLSFWYVFYFIVFVIGKITCA